VSPASAREALARWRGMPQGEEAAIVGTLVNGRMGVVLATELGGERMLDELEDEPLPRIC